ncbi:hypothetical protein [Kingella oralis]|uniref:hypothetical protein n=1 Tax=Kingella oralis TaxID=505 RepID=UPI0034E5A70A
MNIRLSRGLRRSRGVKKGTVFARRWRISRGELAGKGYIAGEDVGIVTVLGQPAQRHVWLFLREVNNLRIIADTWSDKNGNYRFDNLNTELRYLVMAADNFDGKYEPIAYDMAKPYVP